MQVDWYREPRTPEEARAVEKRRGELQGYVEDGLIVGFTVHGITEDGMEVGYSVHGRPTLRQVTVSAEWLPLALDGSGAP